MVTVEHGKTKELNLGRWCGHIRSRKAKLRQDRREKLDSIKFVWNENDYFWNQSYKALCAYARRTGEANPPQRHKETVTVEHGKTKELNFGAWCFWQRTRKTPLSQERREKLNGIKFVWDPVEYDWNQNYNALCEYTRRTGEANPPYNHKETVTVEHGKTKELELGVWCYRLRGRRAQLSQEQREKLEKIGVRLDELVVCEPSEEKRKHLGPLQSNPLIRKRVCVRRDAMVRWGDTQRRKYGNIKVKNCATGTRYLAKIMKNKVVYRKTFADRDAAEHWLTEVGEGRLVPVVVRSPMPMYFTPNEEEEESSEEEEESSEAGPKRRKYGHCEEKKTAKGTQYRAKIIGD
jgi:hypothetical protein